MSGERKKRRERLILALAGTVIFGTACTYETAHYTTFALAHDPRACLEECTHQFNGEQVPEWVDDFFWPASVIDGIVGIYPCNWDPPRVAARR
jgi:hypothetical protein